MKNIIKINKNYFNIYIKILKIIFAKGKALIQRSLNVYYSNKIIHDIFSLMPKLEDINDLREALID